MRVKDVVCSAVLAHSVLALPDNIFPRQTTIGSGANLTGSPSTTVLPTSTATSTAPLTCIQGTCLQECAMVCIGVGLASWWTGTYTVTAATKYETWSMKDGQPTLLNSSNVVNASVSRFLKKAETDFSSYTLPGVPTTLIGDSGGGYERLSVLVLGSVVTGFVTAGPGSSTVSSAVFTSPQQWTEGCAIMHMTVGMVSGGLVASGGGEVNWGNHTALVASETGPAADLNGSGEIFTPMGQQYLASVVKAFPTIPFEDLEIDGFLRSTTTTWPDFPLSLCSGEVDGIPNPHIPVSALTITSAVTLAAVSVPSTPASPTTSASDQTTSTPYSSTEQITSNSGNPVSEAGSTTGQSSTLDTGDNGSSTVNNPPSQEPGSATSQIQSTVGGAGSSSVVTTSSEQATTPTDAGQIFSSILNPPSNEPQSPASPTTAANAPTTGAGPESNNAPSPSAPGNSPTTGAGPEATSTPSGAGIVNPSGGANEPSSSTGVYVVSSASAVTLAGQTLTAGGPAATISGTEYSLGPSGTAIVINGNTTPLTEVTIQGAPTASSIAVITPVTAEGGSTGIVIGSSTLLPGSQVTVSGTTYSLPSTGAGVVVDGTTTQLPSAVTVAGSTGAVVGGQTLLPGSEITVSGTTLSLAPSGGGVVVVPGTTSGGGLGGAIMSGLGQTGQGSSGRSTATPVNPPVSTGGATSSSETSMRWLICCVIGSALMIG